MQHACNAPAPQFVHTERTQDEERTMTQILQLPMWLRFEPVLRFDAEGLFAMAVPCRSEGFAEDLDDLPVPRFSTTETRECEDAARRPERVVEIAA
jgi:hypothetical protein